MADGVPGCAPWEQVFEPRYRLMTRRCMEGSRRFGMAQIGAGHQLNPIAVEVDITDCQPLNDGWARSLSN